MATERKLGAEQQNTIGKGSQGRKHESEGEREHESEREHEGEKEASKRASERAREGRKNPQPVPVPASLYPRTVVVRGTGDPPRGRMKNGLKRKQRKKHEDLNFDSRAVWLIRG
jgi:hypothetical protein